MALADDIERCFDDGWTDGLPVVPPYETLVNRMLAALGWSGADVIGEIKELGVEVRAEQVAAAAVMAGCKTDYGPLLRPLAEALLVPEFNLNGLAVTTGGAGVLVVVSGPVVRELGFAHEANALGATARANATVGRFAAMMRHFCGSLGGALQELGTIGHPGRLGFCVAEHPTTVWAPFHTQLGLEPPGSAVTILATEAPISVNNHYGDSGAKILETIADSIAQYGATSHYWRGFGNPRRAGCVVVLAPEHMALVAKSFTRGEARRFLFEHSVRPTDELVRLGRIPRDPRPELRVEPGAPRGPLGLEEQLTFIESGCPGGKFSAVVPCWVGNYTVSRRIGT
jgi:hypothetical protein